MPDSSRTRQEPEPENLYRRLRKVLRPVRRQFNKSLYWKSKGRGPIVFFRYVMFSLWPRPHRISGKYVVSTLEEKGIPQGEIRGENLDFVYRSMRPMPCAPAKCEGGPKLTRTAKRIGKSSESLWGVIVEPREHPLLEYVVTNVHDTLGIPVQVFHGPAARERILASSLGSLVDKGDVVLTELNVNTLPPPDLNRFLVSDEYWNGLEARKKFLFFQTDSIVCKNSDYSISDFMAYDYIGSKWDWHRPNFLVIHGGCGGLSLQDWEASVECLKRFSFDLWEGAADEFFPFHMDVMGCKVGNELSCMKFATEEIFFTKSFGAHKIERLPEEDLKAFLEYCPEALPLLKGVQHSKAAASA